MKNAPTVEELQMLYKKKEAEKEAYYQKHKEVLLAWNELVNDCVSLCARYSRESAKGTVINYPKNAPKQYQR